MILHFDSNTKNILIFYYFKFTLFHDVTHFFNMGYSYTKYNNVGFPYAKSNNCPVSTTNVISFLFLFFYNDNHPVQVPKTLDVADFVKMQFIRIGEEDDG